MHLQLVTQRKKEFDAWRRNFNEWVRQQRAEQSREHRQNLAIAVQQAQKQGHNVSEIMRAYGTSDRRTVTELLEVPLTSEELPDTLYTFEVVAAGVYRVQDLLFAAENTPTGWFPYVEGADAETPLGVQLNDPSSSLHKQAKEWLSEVCE